MRRRRFDSPPSLAMRSRWSRTRRRLLGRGDARLSIPTFRTTRPPSRPPRN
jgi:hypothetical protein